MIISFQPCGIKLKKGPVNYEHYCTPLNNATTIKRCTSKVVNKPRINTT